MSPALESLAHKPRNKLRKLSKTRPGSLVLRNSTRSPRGSSDSPSSDAAEGGCGRRVPNSPKPASFPSPPDLSDLRWQEYVQRSGLQSPTETSPRIQHAWSQPPVGLVPEFAHLAVVNDTAPGKLRSDWSVLELSPPPSPRSPPAASSSKRRRHAKTPVFRIGQLEGAMPSRPSPLPLPLLNKASEVEQIAEQYRALLDTRSCENLKAGGDPEEDADREAEDTQRQNCIETIRSATTRRTSPSVLSPPRLLPRHSTSPLPPREDASDQEGSLTSDGTLVDFKEDTVLFEPAFSPEALSPVRKDGTASHFAMNPPPQPGALSLQICMDLLTRELASALRRDQPRAGSVQGRGATVAPLQVWLMIEAYETLRDQVPDMRLPLDQDRALEDTLRTWLGALYKVHEDLARSGKSRAIWNRSEGEAEGLASGTGLAF